MARLKPFATSPQAVRVSLRSFPYPANAGYIVAAVIRLVLEIVVLPMGGDTQIYQHLIRFADPAGDDPGPALRRIRPPNRRSVGRRVFQGTLFFGNSPKISKPWGPRSLPIQCPNAGNIILEKVVVVSTAQAIAHDRVMTLVVYVFEPDRVAEFMQDCALCSSLKDSFSFQIGEVWPASGCIHRDSTPNFPPVHRYPHALFPGGK